MRVAVYYNNHDVRVEEMPVPEIGPDEVLLKTMACGICGSDVLEWYRIKSAPRVLGHEATGAIEKVGEKVSGWKPGDRVFVSHHVPCGSCKYCESGHETACETLHTTNFYPGGFSEFIRIPKINVEKGMYRLPPSLSFEDGTLIEPLACVVRGQRLAGVKPGGTALILGCGPSGILHISLAKARGVGKIIATDISDYRLKAAEKFGADETIDARENVPRIVKEIAGGADWVIVCTGAEKAAAQAADAVDRGGVILFFAVPPPGVDVRMPLADFWRNEISVMTSYGAAPRDLAEALALLSEKRVKIDGLITHRFRLSEAQKAFSMVAAGGECLKVIIEPQR
ncbi:MAG: alcohol dehydrogenase catalytic domain-containing protein [Candidatus Hadarchaeales archaeon]